jgi:hypothetical protein
MNMLLKTVLVLLPFSVAAHDNGTAAHDFTFSETVNSICEVNDGAVRAIGGENERCVDDNEITVDTLKQIEIDLGGEVYQLRVIEWVYEFASNPAEPFRLLEYEVAINNPSAPLHGRLGMPQPAQAQSFLLESSEAPVRCYVYSEKHTIHKLCHYGLMKHEAMNSILDSRQSGAQSRKKKCGRK